MPRRPQVRASHDGSPMLPVDDVRRAWLSRWKEWAVGRVPASASPATRSQLRHAVERALGRLTVENPDDEVRDAVDAAIEPIVQATAEREVAVLRDRCLAKQPPPPRRWGRRLATGALVTTLVTAKALDQHPELRGRAGLGLAAGREKLRALLARVTSMTSPPRP